ARGVGPGSPGAGRGSGRSGSGSGRPTLGRATATGSGVAGGAAAGVGVARGAAVVVVVPDPTTDGPGAVGPPAACALPVSPRGSLPGSTSWALAADAVLTSSGGMGLAWMSAPGAPAMGSWGELSSWTSPSRPRAQACAQRRPGPLTAAP